MRRRQSATGWVRQGTHGLTGYTISLPYYKKRVVWPVSLEWARGLASLRISKLFTRDTHKEHDHGF